MHTQGIANRMPADTFVLFDSSWGARESFRIFIRSFKCLSLYLSDNRSHSRYFLWSQLVQQMQEHNRNLIISVRILFRQIHVVPVPAPSSSPSPIKG
jgi:hypothetical protein